MFRPLEAGFELSSGLLSFSNVSHFEQSPPQFRRTVAYCKSGRAAGLPPPAHACGGRFSGPRERANAPAKLPLLREAFDDRFSHRVNLFGVRHGGVLRSRRNPTTSSPIRDSTAAAAVGS